MCVTDCSSFPCASKIPRFQGVRQCHQDSTRMSRHRTLNNLALVATVGQASEHLYWTVHNMLINSTLWSIKGRLCRDRTQRASRGGDCETCDRHPPTVVGAIRCQVLETSFPHKPTARTPRERLKMASIGRL